MRDEQLSIRCSPASGKSLADTPLLDYLRARVVFLSAPIRSYLPPTRTLNRTCTRTRTLCSGSNRDRSRRDRAPDPARVQVDRRGDAPQGRDRAGLEAVRPVRAAGWRGLCDGGPPGECVRGRAVPRYWEAGSILIATVQSAPSELDFMAWVTGLISERRDRVASVSDRRGPAPHDRKDDRSAARVA